jgi:hypothetical protein
MRVDRVLHPDVKARALACYPANIFPVALRPGLNPGICLPSEVLFCLTGGAGFRSICYCKSSSIVNPYNCQELPFTGSHCSRFVPARITRDVHALFFQFQIKHLMISIPYEVCCINTSCPPRGKEPHWYAIARIWTRHIGCRSQERHGRSS